MNADSVGTEPRDLLRSVLKSQYHAALATLRGAIEACPRELWVSDEFPKPYWRVAYHALYFAHFYLQPRVPDFVPWDLDQHDIHSLDDRPPPRGFDDNEEFKGVPESPPQTGKPYTQAEVLAYWDLCDSMIDAGVDRLDLLSNESGFSWYRVPKIEHQIISIRHIQHHAAQLAERLRHATHTHLEWVGAQRRQR